MIRQNIQCEHVISKQRNHAWNIVNIDGFLIPFEVTWDAVRFYKGKKEYHSFVNLQKFINIEYHVPNEAYPTQEYQKNLVGLPEEFVTEVMDTMIKRRGYSQTTQKIIKKDGTKYLITQISGDRRLGYKYIYQLLDKNDKLIGQQQILYSKKFNVCSNYE